MGKLGKFRFPRGEKLETEICPTIFGKLIQNCNKILLRYICHRWAFSEDIIEKCVICKIEDNGIKHVTNNCIKFKKVREELIDKLNKLYGNTKNNWILLL